MNEQKYPLTAALLSKKICMGAAHFLESILTSEEILGVVVSFVSGTNEAPNNQKSFEELKVKEFFNTASENLCQALEILLSDLNEKQKAYKDKYEEVVKEVDKLLDKYYPLPTDQDD